MCKLLLIIIFTSSINCIIGQKLKIEYGTVDSMELKNLILINETILDSNIIFLNGNVHIINNSKLISSNGLGKAWQKGNMNIDFLNYDSVNEKNKLIEFSYFFASTKDTSIKYEIDGVTYADQVYINKNKFCLMKYGYSNHELNYINTLKQKNKFLDTISEWKRVKLYDTSASFVNAYNFKISGYFPKSDYMLDIYLNPKVTYEESKNNQNALLSNNIYVPIKKCHCENVEPVMLIHDPMYRKDRKRANYDVSHSYKYMLIRLLDYKIIEFGEFSFENGELYQYDAGEEFKRKYHFRND